MDLTHTFTVPASVEETWDAFVAIEDVAGCFPGASVTSVEGDYFTGTCKVKLGPIALVYAGAGSFLEKDQSAHRFVIEAKGKDKRGSGTAKAKVTAVLTAASPASTDVEVRTDLSITGKPAQFGRGVIQDVSDKLLQQFVGCLETTVGGPSAEEAQAEVASPAAPMAGAGSGQAAPFPAGAQDAATAATAAASAASAAEAAAAAAAGRPGVTASGADTTAAGSTPRKVPESAYAGASAGRSPGAGQEDALDLGATVLPILLKAYWRQLAAGLLVLLVLKRLLGRRRR